MATYTASLALSDSGNTYSSATSSPLKINAETYTKAYSKIADLAVYSAGATGYATLQIPFDAKFVMIRATSGTIFTYPYDSAISLTNPTLNNFLPTVGFKLAGTANDKGASGWFVYGCTTSPTTGIAINRVYVRNASAIATATYEIIAYG